MPALKLVSETPNVIEADCGLVAWRQHPRGYVVFVGRKTVIDPRWTEVDEAVRPADALLFSGVTDFERFMNDLESTDHAAYCDTLAKGWQLAVARISVDFDALIVRD